MMSLWCRVTRQVIQGLIIMTRGGWVVINRDIKRK